MVAGAFDCADIIARVRDAKTGGRYCVPTAVQVSFASAASRRLVTQTARTGSIGVMMAHSNYGAALEKQGVEITLIYSGSHRWMATLQPSPDDVRETLQSRMDATRRMFAQKICRHIPACPCRLCWIPRLQCTAVREAIDAGLADELVNSTDATVMRDALDARKSRLSGGRMTKETQSTTVSATACAG